MIARIFWLKPKTTCLLCENRDSRMLLNVDRQIVKCCIKGANLLLAFDEFHPGEMPGRPCLIIGLSTVKKDRAPFDSCCTPSKFHLFRYLQNLYEQGQGGKTLLLAIIVGWLVKWGTALNYLKPEAGWFFHSGGPCQWVRKTVYFWFLRWNLPEKLGS